MFLRLATAMFGSLGWWPTLAEVIHPVEEDTDGDGALKTIRYEVARPVGNSSYLDQTLRRTIGGHGLIQ